MRRLALTVSALLLSSCYDGLLQSPLPPAPPPGPPPPTFAVTGRVIDEDSLPVPLAYVDVMGYTPGAYTDADGRFRLENHRGDRYLQVYKAGYIVHQRAVRVLADVNETVLLFRVGLLSDSIIFGQTIRSVVHDTNPPCDPMRWDFRAPCKRFPILPPESGSLNIRIWWMGDPPLDALLVDHNGVSMAISRELHPNEHLIELYVEAGKRYELRVNSYYSAQVFDLRAELWP